MTFESFNFTFTHASVCSLQAYRAGQKAHKYTKDAATQAGEGLGNIKNKAQYAAGETIEAAGRVGESAAKATKKVGQKTKGQAV